LCQINHKVSVLTPRIAAFTRQGAQIKLSLANLTPPFGVSVEASTNLATGSWLAQTNFVPTTMATNILLPEQGDKKFYRVRTPSHERSSKPPNAAPSPA